VISALSEINGHEALHSSLRNRALQEILSSELSYVKQLEVIMKVCLFILIFRSINHILLNIDESNKF
jgi:hypothetical protein